MKGAVILICALTVVLGNDIRAIPEQTTENDVDDGTCNCDPAEAPEICAQIGSDGVLVAHEYCNRFYKCAGGTPITLGCPGKLAFNPYKKKCDWPENVDCGNKTMASNDEDNNGGNEEEDDSTGPINDDPSKAPEICAEKKSDGVLVAHEYCNWFYNCFDGIPFPQKCPVNLVYNARKRRCDWPENIECGNKTISEPEINENTTKADEDNEIDGPINDDPAKAAELCAQLNSDDVFVAHEYCNRFYNCLDGKPISQTCPAELLYNPRKERCDWPINVYCGDRIIPEPDDSEGNNNNGTDDDEIDGPINDNPAEAAEICSQEKSDSILIAHEYCNRFYICFDGNPVTKRCPADLLYNPRKARCDWPVNVNCGNRTIPEPDDEDDKDDGNNEEEIDGPIYDNPAEAPEICARNDTHGVLVAHENCDQFYICNIYVPVALDCVIGLLFNPRKARCDWPVNVDCGDRIIRVRNETKEEKNETCNNCDPSEAVEICAREGSNGVLVAHENCNQYFKCYAGEPNVLSCINKLLFNPIKGWCDWPEQVDCGDRIIPDNDNSGNSNPSQAKEICGRAGSEGALVAHEVCSQFYKCSHGEPVALECQAGLLFDPVLGVCDWPRNVDCGDRQQ